MKYCSHCGKELDDEAIVCTGCGCAAPSKSGTVTADQKATLGLIAKIFMIIGCVVTGFALIPLAWTIPMTIHACNKIDNKEPLGIGFKVCALLFVSAIAGILMLCMDND